MSSVGASMLFGAAMERISRGERFNLGLATGVDRRGEPVALPDVGKAPRHHYEFVDCCLAGNP